MSIPIELYLKADLIFTAKLASGKYEEYKDSRELRILLYKDCVRQALGSDKYNGKIYNTAAAAIAQ